MMSSLGVTFQKLCNVALRRLRKWNARFMDGRPGNMGLFELFAIERNVDLYAQEVQMCAQTRESVLHGVCLGRCAERDL